MQIKQMTRKTHLYLVDIRQTAASRITGDTTSWMARRNVGHLWVETVSKVQLCEICRQLWKEQKKTRVTICIMNSKRHLKITLDTTPHHLDKNVRKDPSFLNSKMTKSFLIYQKSYNKFFKVYGHSMNLK